MSYLQLARDERNAFSTRFVISEFNYLKVSNSFSASNARKTDIRWKHKWALANHQSYELIHIAAYILQNVRPKIMSYYSYNSIICSQNFFEIRSSVTKKNVLLIRFFLQYLNLKDLDVLVAKEFRVNSSLEYYICLVINKIIKIIL